VVKVTESLTEVQGKRFVRLNVLPLPSDITKVACVVRMDDPDPKSTVGFRTSNVVEIASGWELAWKIARERDAELILIVDPKRLIPTDKEGMPQTLMS
jgi:hypothetical protein